MKKKMIIAILICFFSTILIAQEGQKELVIETLNNEEGYDIKGGECHPGDIIITIKSDIKELIFDSNVIDINDVSYIKEKNEYVFCHSNESFWLTFGSKSHISKKIYIDGKSSKYAFRVVEKNSLGKVLFKTKPNNALIDFGFEGQSPQLSNVPIEINSGEYKVRISKHGYIPVDTLIQVPSGGNTNQFDIYLKPAFAKIQLDIKSADNSDFKVYPTIEIDTARINLGELVNNNKPRTFDDVDNLQFFKLYSGGIIPVPSGSYAITITAPGFKSYFTRIVATKGAISPLSISLEPITGYLTIIDQKNAMDAKVFIDDKLVGNIPLYRQRVRVGNHIVKIEKDGYMSEKKEYPILSEEEKEIDLPINMTIFKRYYLSSKPIGAEILVNGKREGFTPFLLPLGKGSHKIELRKYGYLDFKKEVQIDEKINTASIDTINCTFEKNIAFYIESEKEGVKSIIKRLNDTVFIGKLPAKIELPIGRYKMFVYNDRGHNIFKGSINHTGKKEKTIKIPNYSRGTFTTLAGDYFISKPALESRSKDLYNLVASTQFGRFNLLPGLSTSILKATLFSVSKSYKNRTIYTVQDTPKDIFYPNYVFAASCLFLNGEFRVGVPILKELDIAALGTYTYYPNLEKIIGISHVNGEEIFIGLELTSRISSLNANIKIGSKIFKNASYNFYTDDEITTSLKDYSDFYYKTTAKFNQFVISAGFTLGEKKYNGNNMLRITKKPLISNY